MRRDSQPLGCSFIVRYRFDCSESYKLAGAIHFRYTKRISVGSFDETSLRHRCIPCQNLAHLRHTDPALAEVQVYQLVSGSSWNGA
ncbi:hypothetical protein D3C75_619780 [compost metagenome]